MQIHKYSADSFSNEHSRLKALIPSDIYAILQAHNAIIAGGTITSLFTNNPVNDLDIYFRTWQELESFTAFMHSKKLREGEYDLNGKKGGWSEPYKHGLRVFSGLDGLQDVQWPEVPSESLDIGTAVFNIGMTDKSIMYTFQGEAILQIIAFTVFPGGAEAIFKKFDWTINMGAFDFSTEEWIMPLDFMKHNSQKMLFLNPETDYPIISLLRVGKYVSRGYKISRKEMLKLGVAVARLNISKWKDAKKHLSGMYGTSVEELFPEEDHFSIDSLFDKLDKAENDYICRIATDTEGRPTNAMKDEIPWFSILQRLRRNTERPYVNQIFAVGYSSQFYLFDKTKSSQNLHLGLNSEQESTDRFNSITDIFKNQLSFYHKKEAAVNHMKYKAESAQENFSGQRGGIVIECSIKNTDALDFTGESLLVMQGADVTLQAVVDSIGDYT